MPHLQFEVNQKLETRIKDKFVHEIRACFSEIMNTGTDKYNLTIGRTHPEEDICLMNLDIREGRAIEKRRELALRYMDIVRTNFNVEARNQYITYTQHPGEDFHLVEKYLANWEPDEDPLV